MRELLKRKILPHIREILPMLHSGVASLMYMYVHVHVHNVMAPACYLSRQAVLTACTCMYMYMCIM